MPRSVRITRILSMTDHVATQLRGLHFAGFLPPATEWQPSVNVYEHAEGLEICVDLAGVRREDIAVQVDRRRLIIRGHREMPDCGRGREGCGRLLIMEIPDGGFERVLEFGWDLDARRIDARQDNGWLYISLPHASQEGRP